MTRHRYMPAPMFHSAGYGGREKLHPVHPEEVLAELRHRFYGLDKLAWAAWALHEAEERGADDKIDTAAQPDLELCHALIQFGQDLSNAEQAIACFFDGTECAKRGAS
ncbi:MAG: hypothetical protein ACREM1_15570 [Longimicrobiales bacterium]